MYSNKTEIIFMSVAGFNIKIIFKLSKNSKNNSSIIRQQIKYYYSGYILSNFVLNKVDYSITFLESKGIKLNIKKNIGYSQFYECYKNNVKTYYQISIFQFQLILLKIIEELLKDKGAIFHASSCRLNDKSVLFVGKQGAGKSTISNLLNEKFEKISDDNIVIRQIKNKLFVYQLPLLESEWGIKKKLLGFEVCKIFFIRKDVLFKSILIDDNKYILNRLNYSIKQYFTLKNYHANKIKFLLRIIRIKKIFYHLNFSKNEFDFKKIKELFFC